MRTYSETVAVVMMMTSMVATVLGAPQFIIPVPDKPANLYGLPSQDFISIPKPQKPSGLYELPSSASNNNRVVLGDPIFPAANNPISTARPITFTTARPITFSTSEPQPLMPYEMSYNIMDGINSVYHTREEVQTDTGLTGSYSYLRPDGIYQTVEYYVDAMGYHANVIESDAPPANLQKVESNRAKYEVKLPHTDSYLIDVDDAELQGYIQDALNFEAAVIPQASQVSQVSQQSQGFQVPQVPQQSQVSQVVQASRPPQLTATQPTQEIQTPIVALQPPSTGYNYPAPARPFNPFSG